jgi:ribulose-bisphosphate carboxylase large chain
MERDTDTMIEPGERVHATYLMETAFPLREAAEAMAGEQSTGTFVRVAGETAELRQAHAARVEGIEELEPAATPSLPGAKVPTGVNRPIWHRAQVRLSWPVSNFCASLPNILATVAGNLFEVGQFSGLRLIDLRFPPSFAEAFRGPAFGVAGTHRMAGVAQGPLVGTIVKPSVGLSPEATAATVRALCAGGIDFIKDDELHADGPHCPFDERVRHVMAVIGEYAQRTGKKVLYAFNITDDSTRCAATTMPCSRRAAPA